MGRVFSLVQLTHFTETARAGSMTDAARRLHMSQPALSSSISQLERELGVTLFERIPRRGVRPTRDGRQFYEEAVVLLAQARALEESFTRTHRNLGGHLRIGIYAPIAPFRAPQVLQAFTQQYPGVELELLEADQDQLSRMLTDGDADVALSYAMVPFSGLHAEVLEDVPPHVIVPTSHRLSSREDPVHLAELASDPLILLDLPHTGGYYLGLFRRLGLVPTVRFRVSGYETVRGFVARGFGISILNQRVPVRRTFSGELVRTLDIADDVPSVAVHVVCRPDEREQPLIDAFHTVCRELYPLSSSPSM